MARELKHNIVILLLFINYFSIARDYYYATSKLNIRIGRGKNYSIVGSLDKGEKVTIDSINFGWGAVLVNNKTIGFVSTKYLSKDPVQTSIESDTNKIPQKESSPFKTIFIITILIIIIWYQIFGKSKRKSGSTKQNYSSHLSSKMKSIIVPIVVNELPASRA